MTTRNYSNTATEATLTGGISSSDTSWTLTSFSGFPATPFTAAIERGTDNEEIVLVTSVSAGTVICTRGYDGTTAKSHTAGATFLHVVIAKDYTEANTHINSSTNVHGTTGAVVGTSDTQTLSNKTLNSPTITSPTVTGTMSGAAVSLSGALTVTGATSLAGVTASGTLAVTGASTLTGNTAVGGTLTVTGATTLGTATVGTLTVSTAASVPTPTSAGHAVTKAYADALGTSAATVSTIARRDASGRLAVVAPAASSDVATKGYVDAAPTTLAKAQLYQSIQQTGLATGWQTITLNNETHDSHNGHALGDQGYTVPAGQGGTWLVFGTVALASTPDNLVVGIRVRVNNLDVPVSVGENGPLASTGGNEVVLPGLLLTLLDADVVTLQGFLNTGNWATVAYGGSGTSACRLTLVRIA